jgi:AraC family transcriptional regulator
LRPVLEERDAFQVAGVMALVKGEQEVIPQLWDTLARELADIGSIDTRGRFYGIVWYPRGWQERGYFYLAAVEVKPRDVVGSALVVKTMPPSKCARFIHKGPYRDLGLTLDYIYQTWLPKSGKRIAGPFEIQDHGHDLGNPGDEAFEMEIYIPIE